MATALDIITDALQTIGELPAGQTCSPEDAAFCITRLNAMLDSWSQDGALIFTRNIAAFGLTATVGTYAIGPTAAAPFNVVRPTKIDLARILIQISGVSVGVKELKVIDYSEFVSYSDKTSTSIIPETLYYDNAMPNGTLHLFDIPSAPNTQLELTTWSQLQQFPTLVAALSMPPGYYEAIVQSLAIAISPGYNKPLDQVTLARATQCVERIKTINAMILRPGLPPAAYLPQGAPAGAAPQQVQ